MGMSASEAIQFAEETVELIDEDVPEWALEKAPDFFEDVRRKVVEVMETIEERGVVTPRQESALQGWRSGVEKWIK